jgi:hypothetical protein
LNGEDGFFTNGFISLVFVGVEVILFFYAVKKLEQGIFILDIINRLVFIVNIFVFHLLVKNFSIFF